MLSWHLFGWIITEQWTTTEQWQLHVIQLILQKNISPFIIAVSNCMQGVVIIFLLCDTAGPPLLLCFTELFVSRNVGRTVQEAFLEPVKCCGHSLCRQRPFDSVSAFSRPLCLRCLFDVTLAERGRNHWVAGVLFCCVPFTPAVERTESNTTRLGHCLPVELIALMAPP